MHFSIYRIWTQSDHPHTHSHFKFYASAALVVASASVFIGMTPAGLPGLSADRRVVEPIHVSSRTTSGATGSGHGRRGWHGAGDRLWIPSLDEVVDLVGFRILGGDSGMRLLPASARGTQVVCARCRIRHSIKFPPFASIGTRNTRPQDVGLFVGGYMLTLLRSPKSPPPLGNSALMHVLRRMSTHVPRKLFPRAVFETVSKHRSCVSPAISSKYAMPRTTWLESPLGGSRTRVPPSKGLWWMEGNIFAQELLCIENPGIVQWNTQENHQGSVVSSTAGIIAPDPSVDCWDCWEDFVYTDIEFLVDEDPRPTGWIRTQVSILPGRNGFLAHSGCMPSIRTKWYGSSTMKKAR